MKKFLPVAFALVPCLALAQDLPRYPEPRQSKNDPDVWYLTQAHAGKRTVDLYYTALAEIIAVNASQADQQRLPPETRRAKLHRDSVEYTGGVLFVAAACPDRSTIDGNLTVVVLDDARQEVLRRTLTPGEAELSVSADDFARIYTVPLSRPLPPNACVLVEDQPAHQRHEFRLRPLGRGPAGP